MFQWQIASLTLKEINNCVVKIILVLRENSTVLINPFTVDTHLCVIEDAKDITIYEANASELLESLGKCSLGIVQ